MAWLYDLIKDVYPGRQNWRLKARIVRMWELSPMEQLGNPFAIEMGGKIQATIRKPMIRKFRGALVERRVYRMIFFGVVKNTGSYRACRHEFKLLFHGRTRVAECEGVPIPMYGLSLVTTEDIKNTGGRSDYLIDFMGILSAVSSEKTSDRSGRTTRFIVIELKDDKGMICCALFGEYVDEINVHLAEAGDEFPVVVVLTLNGFDIGASIGVIGEGYKELPLKDDFLGRKRDGGEYFCPACCINVDHVTPRFKLKLEVFDGEDTAALILFDSDAECLLGKSCADLLAEAESVFIPPFPNLDRDSSNGAGRVEVHDVVDVTCELDAEAVNLEEITIDNEGYGPEEKIHAGETNLKKKKNMRLKKVKIERE
ncbi:Nucleic acid-binding, OB-fold [Sesbania bispinosa]|nr:Nucleic acid-binding, OB-fold [Sesbania bispinosa]